MSNEQIQIPIPAGHTDAEVIDRYRNATNKLKKDVEKLKMDIKKLELEKKEAEIEFYRNSDEGLSALMKKIEVEEEKLKNKEGKIKEKEVEIRRIEFETRQYKKEKIKSLNTALATREHELSVEMDTNRELDKQVEDLQKKNAELKISNDKLNKYSKFEAMEI
jgi:chromosome segregation ATPase